MWIYICVFTVTYVNAVLNNPRSALVRGSGEFPANLKTCRSYLFSSTSVRFSRCFSWFLLIGNSISLFRLRGKMVSSLWGPPISPSTLLLPNSISPISFALTYPSLLRGRVLRMRLGRLGNRVSLCCGLYCSLGLSRRMIDKPRNSEQRSHPTGREDDLR